MSTNFVEIVCIDELVKHENADKLEIAKIKGTQVVVPKDVFVPGQPVVYFPPDMLIPEEFAVKVGVHKYLKHAIWDGIYSTACRVGATRLRGVPSYGFVISLADAHLAIDMPGYEVGSDVTEHFGADVTQKFKAKKYTPPVRIRPEDMEPENLIFHKYTDIEHWWRYQNVLEEGELVRITEKIHGTNSRVGVINTDGDFKFMGGSHRVIRKQYNAAGELSAYWRPFEDGAVMELINDLCDAKHNVVLFGEIYGKYVQDMDYGTAFGYRVFDCSVDGVYLDWEQLVVACVAHGVPTVPVLYTGPYSKALVEQYTHGPTTVAEPDQIGSAFKGREGIVITPCKERFSAILGRVILKSVSADYIGRKGGTDEE